MKNFFRLYKTEWIKGIHQKFFYIGPVLCFIVSFLWLKGFESIGDEDGKTAYHYLATGLQAAMTSIIPIFIVIYSSISISGEATKGTLKYNFFHPVGRVEFFSSKVAMSFTYVVILLLSNLVGLLIFGFIYYDFKEYSEFGNVILTVSDLNYAVVKTLLLSLLPLSSYMAFGVFVSSATRNIASSIGFGLGIILGLEPTRHLIKIGSFDINDFLFMNYTDKTASRLIETVGGFNVKWNTHDILYGCVQLPLITIGIFIAAGLILFLKRDIKSF